MSNTRLPARLFAMLLVVAMLVTAVAPMAAAAGADAESGPAALTGRVLLDSLQARRFANEAPPRDEAVIAEAAGVPLNASAEEAQALSAAWEQQFAAKKEKSGPNPIAYAQRMRDLQQAQAMGKSPLAAGLGEVGVAKMLMIPFEFDGEDTIARCDADGNPIDEVTVEGPLHGTIPNPGDFGDNFTIWTDDFSVDWYQNLMFGNGVGVIRTDLNGGAGVDLTGVSAAKWYEEQSEGLYSIDGDIYTAWIQLPHSVAFYGWDGDELSPDGVGYPCDGTPAGPGYQFAIDVVNGVNEVDPDFDWAQYDVNGDQIVDHLMLIHAGVDNSAGGGEFGNFQLWAHSWDILCDNDGDGALEYGCIVQGEDTPDPSDDIYVGNYTHIPEDADIGVVVHEYGHDIGLPDYYDTSGATNNSSSHWDVMNSGSWNGLLGGSHPTPFNPWSRWFFGWSDPMEVNYDDPASEVMIGQSDPTPSGSEDAVWVHLPDQLRTRPNLAGDGKGWHAEIPDLSIATAAKQFDLSAASGSVVFSFDTWYQIEELWDYGFVEVSTDDGATWTGLPDMDGTTTDENPNGVPYWPGCCGLTGQGEGRLRYDLSAYAGQSSAWVRFTYATDWGTQESGWYVDNISLDDASGNLYANDLEDGSDWTIDGWAVVPYDLRYPHYYMLEWRNNQGSIASLGHDWNYQTVTDDMSGWRVDRVPHNTPGLLVWYRNQLYSNNNVVAGGREFDGPAVGAKGSTLLVDSHNDAIEYSGGIWNPAANAQATKMSNRRASSDGAFTLETTPAWMIHDYGLATNPVLDFGSQPAAPAFHDSLRSVPGWYFPGDGFVYRVLRDSSVVVPAQGTYSTRIRSLQADNAHLDREGDLTAFWGYTVGGLPLGPGHPGASGVQYGVHAKVLSRAADGSYGMVRIWNAPFEFDGMITQTAGTNPVVRGTRIDVNFQATNVGGSIDAFVVMPLDEDEMYVAGSAYGGATPLTAAYLGQLASERGLNELASRAASAAADDVVAIAYMGPVATGEMLDFGFMTEVTSMSGSIHHSAAIFDGSHFIQDIHSDSLEIVDNSAYTVNRSRRFDVDRDTFLDGGQPSSFFGSDQTMWVGFYDQMRPVVHTRLDGIPRDSYVDVAYLYLYIYDGRGFQAWPGSVLNVEAHPVTSPWMPDAANWVTPWANPGGDFGATAGVNHVGSGKVGTWLRLDVTSAVETMLRTGVNHGFILTSDDVHGIRYGFATKDNWTGLVGYLRVMFRTAN